MDLFIRPEKFIKELPYIKSNQNVADFGCGSGYFTLEIAKKITAQTKVYAIDVLKEPLLNLKSKSELLGVFNIKYVISDLEKIGGSLLENESVSVVFIANILFQIKNQEILIQEATRILKTGGHIVILEYEDNFQQFGPPKNLRIAKEKLKEILENMKLEPTQDFKPSESHYCLVYKK